MSWWIGCGHFQNDLRRRVATTVADFSGRTAKCGRKNHVGVIQSTVTRTIQIKTMSVGKLFKIRSLLRASVGRKTRKKVPAGSWHLWPLQMPLSTLKKKTTKKSEEEEGGVHPVQARTGPHKTSNPVILRWDNLVVTVAYWVGIRPGKLTFLRPIE